MISLSFIDELPNGHLLISGTMNNQLTNVEITTSGVLVNQQACVYPIRKILPTVGSVFIAKNAQGQLESYTSNLSLITNSGFTVSDYDLRNDSIFTVGNSVSPDNLFYKIYDLNFNLLYQSSVSYKNISPSGIVLDNKNKLNVITRGWSTPNPEMSFTGYYQFPVSGGFQSKSDIGIINSSVLSTTYSSFYNNQYGGTINMNVTVKNFGTDTIHNFYLNYYSKFMWCYSLFHKRYTTQILPGATVQVNTGDFELNTGFNPTPNLTSIPNESNDIEIANDARCDTVVYLLTGINEMTLETSVKIFPNPFNEQVQIRSQLKIKKLSLTNALGQVMFEKLVNETDFYLNSSAWLNGLYFLHLETESGVITKKLLKN